MSSLSLNFSVYDCVLMDIYEDVYTAAGGDKGPSLRGLVRLLDPRVGER